MRPSSNDDGVLWRAVLAVLVGGNFVLALGLAGAQSLGLLNWPPAAQADAQGWRQLLGAGGFWHALGYSAALTAITVLLAVGLALLLQRALGTALRRGLVARVLYLPLAVPGVAAALLAFIVLGDSGILARLGHAVGWVATPADFPPLLFEASGRGIVLTHLVLVTPLFVLLFERLARHLRLPAVLEQARTLGASPWQAWRGVALPLLLRQAMPVIVVYALALLGAYEIPLMIGGTRPPMVAVAIARAINGPDLATRPHGYAMACTYLVLVMLAWIAVMIVPRARPR